MEDIQEVSIFGKRFLAVQDKGLGYSIAVETACIKWCLQAALDALASKKPNVKEAHSMLHEVLREIHFAENVRRTPKLEPYFEGWDKPKAEHPDSHGPTHFDLEQ